MYCPTCGSKIENALNFCSRCGGKIEKKDASVSVSAYQSIGTTVGVVGLGGMIALVILSLKFLKEGIDIGSIAGIIAMFLVSILAMVYMIIRLMPKYYEKSSPEAPAVDRYVAPRSLHSAKTAQLEEPKQSPASVIENTTRTLDEVFVKKN